ncbi:MAG: hypothetical protein ACOX4Q_01595 [Syntrophomonadales bacterium]|jgi:hypothetical protein
MRFSKRTNHSFLIFSVTFFLLFLVVFCTGYFREEVAADSGLAVIELPAPKGCCGPMPLQFEVKDASESFLQTKIVNQGQKTIWLRVQVKGIDKNDKLIFMDQSNDEQTCCFSKPLNPGETLEVGLNLKIAREELNSGVTTIGTIEFSDYRSEKVLIEIPVQVIKVCNDSNCD